jgi:hypothetical protein
VTRILLTSLNPYYDQFWSEAQLYMVASANEFFPIYYTTAKTYLNTLEQV